MDDIGEGRKRKKRKRRRRRRREERKMWWLGSDKMCQGIRTVLERMCLNREGCFIFVVVVVSMFISRRTGKV